MIFNISFLLKMIISLSLSLSHLLDLRTGLVRLIYLILSYKLFIELILYMRSSLNEAMIYVDSTLQIYLNEYCSYRKYLTLIFFFIHHFLFSKTINKENHLCSMTSDHSLSQFYLFLATVFVVVVCLSTQQID